MDDFRINIDKQIKSNKGRNLFSDTSTNPPAFIDETISAIANLGDISPEYERSLIDYATEKCLQEFCRINQYFAFNNQDKADLMDIYVDLFSSIKQKTEPIDAISKNHYHRLKNWLQRTNPHAEEIYQNKEGIITPIACAEYSAAFQIEMLHIDIQNLIGPILDIGCGKQGNLIHYLRHNGIDAHGIDRFATTSPFVSNEDWLEFDYGNTKWGAIVSNLGFSNHFVHHHLRSNGNFMVYAKKYMHILNSLKIKGKFHYAPSLNFIEQYLDKNTFNVEHHSVKDFNVAATIVTRLK